MFELRTLPSSLADGLTTWYWLTQVVLATAAVAAVLCLGNEENFVSFPVVQPR